MHTYVIPVLALGLLGYLGGTSSLLSQESPSEDWPFTNRADEGMIWYWGNANLHGEIVDADGNWLREGDLVRREESRLNWFLGAQPATGYLEAIDLGPTLAQHLGETPHLIWEMVVHPPAQGVAEGTLIAAQTYSDDPIWRLFVHDQTLAAEQADGIQIAIAELDLSQPRHLNLVLTESGADLWVDGEHTATLSAELLPVFPDPWDAMVSFGGSPGEHLSWTGAMEYLAVRHTFSQPEAGFAAWQKAVGKRSEPPRGKVQAKLVQSAREPNPAEISEYGEGILAMAWVVLESEYAGLNPDDQILTWHWYFLDRMVLPEAAAPEPGSIRSLQISDWESNPQLQGVQQIDTDLEPDQLILLPQFFLAESEEIN